MPTFWLKMWKKKQKTRLSNTTGFHYVLVVYLFVMIDILKQMIKFLRLKMHLHFNPGEIMFTSHFCSIVYLFINHFVKRK